MNINFVKHKNIFFLISTILLIPGIISLIFNGLKLGIDFTGGSLIEINLKKPNSNINIDELTKIIKTNQIEVASIQKSGNNGYLFRTKAIDQKKDNQIIQSLKAKYPEIEQTRFESVGPTIGAELTRNALIAIVVATVFIVLYIAYSFRKVPAPASSWRFGLTAVAALLHDTFFVLGVFSILGKLFNVEIDSLFVTAVLTVIGFSVHDTIVVYDRIRENLLKANGKDFPDTVNISLRETLGRSINTSLTVIIVLAALLILGGETTRWFVFALLIGILIGTYSSIFNASQLLVLWHEKTNKIKE